MAIGRGEPIKAALEHNKVGILEEFKDDPCLCLCVYVCVCFDLQPLAWLTNHTVACRVDIVLYKTLLGVSRGTPSKID